MKLSNIRLENHGDMCRVAVDVDSPFYDYKECFYEVPSQYGDYLTYDVYDAFIVGLLYPCSKHGEDIEIDGAMSKKLYRNLTEYAIHLLDIFSKETNAIKIKPKNFKIPDKRHHHIGTGFSGGVDSFCTIYDRYEKETDPEYKVDTLVCFNAGSHGDYENKNTYPKFLARYEYLSEFPKEVGLAFIPMNSNIHAFMDEGHTQSGMTRHASCMLALQAGLDKYYHASDLSYWEDKMYGNILFENVFSEFGEPFIQMWFSTESFDLISEGGQYFRSEKLEHIVDYKYAQKYLNVCVNPGVTGHENCSKLCGKCDRTLIALESIDGGLEKFSKVFDINEWKKHSFMYKCQLIIGQKKDFFMADNVRFAKKHGNKMPSYFTARLYMSGYWIYRKIVYVKGAFNYLIRTIKRK